MEYTNFTLVRHLICVIYKALIINKLQNYKTQTLVRACFGICFCAVLLLAGCTKRAEMDAHMLENERLLVWADPDSALTILDSISTDRLNQHDRHIYDMERHLALSRIHHTPYYTEAVDSLLAYFQTTNDMLSIGEACYMLGTSSNHTGHYYTSTHFLKQAEYALLKTNGPLRNQLLGVTWFCLGNTSESELLYEVARNYYLKAIPMLRQGQNNVFLACAYRDIARTNAILHGNPDTTRLYFDRAAAFGDLTDNRILQLDIAAYRYQYCFPDSINERIATCTELAEKYGITTRYAELVEIFLEQNDTQSAKQYLKLLQPTDSANANWFKQNQTYLQARLAAHEGNTLTAFNQLLDLYDNTLQQLQLDAGARTFGIAQAYDVEREQQRAEEAERERRMQQQISLLLVAAFIMVLMMLYLLWRYYRSYRKQKQLELDQQQIKIVALREKYTNHLQRALDRLQQRANLSREIALQHMRGRNTDIPEWLERYMEEKLAFTPEGIDELIATTDKELDGAVSRLRAAYPKLTESDMQFVILVIIGASDTDMSIVLNVQKSTIYHRRQIVRKHIDSSIEDIDSWLKEYVYP